MVAANEQSRPAKVELLWINISHFSPVVQICLLSFFIFVFHILCGCLQEHLFTIEGLKQNGWYLTLVQFLYFAILSGIELRCRAGQRKIPWLVHLLITLLTIGTVGFSNVSLQYLNYPTQVLFKCCKVIPVMIGGIIIQKKKYTLTDYVASFIISFGLVAFCVVSSQSALTFHYIGVLMVTCALICDSIIGNTQEKVLIKSNALNVEVTFFSHLMGFCILLTCITAHGSLRSGIEFSLQHPIVYLYSLVFSISGYLGVQIVLSLLRNYGALTTVTVTTCRKIVSIVISFIFFKKPFSIHFVWAGSLIIVGVYLNVFGKNNIDILAIFKSLLLRRKKGFVLNAV